MQIRQKAITRRTEKTSGICQHCTAPQGAGLTSTEAREAAWGKLRSWRDSRRLVKLVLRSSDLLCANSAMQHGRSCLSSYALSDLDSGRLGPAASKRSR